MNALVPVIAEKFRKHFPDKPLLVVSPGRVNLIGEHTDYNEGFVLPGATDKAVVFAVSPRTDGVCHFVSHDYDQEFRSEIGQFHRSPLRWPDYLQGVVDQFLKAGYRVGGFNCVFGGDIPIGAGMSSSAALEGGLAFALNALSGLKHRRPDPGQAGPESRERVRGRPLRHHGPVHQHLRPGEEPSQDRLPLARVRAHSLRAGGPPGGRLRHPGPPRAGLVRIQRPPRPVRGRGRGPQGP
ncbi:MAG: hypothetical protein M0C28_45965 [Candidatus Moduliflexus flocculans]|nr:hypothetical protein [Candidatus Moduliflexus flocculans]